MSPYSLTLSMKEPYPSPAALLKAGIDLGYFPKSLWVQPMQTQVEISVYTRDIITSPSHAGALLGGLWPVWQNRPQTLLSYRKQ